MLILTMMVTVISSNAQQNAKYCMTYEDFLADNWKTIESLVDGRTNQLCQMRFEDDQYKFKTGDKEADAVLKKQAFAVEYSGNLYINCRNLRCNDIPIDVNNYAQAFRYEGNKICVVAHWINGAAVMGSLAGTVVGALTPAPIAIPSLVGAAVIDVNYDKLCSYRCYILENNANAKGKTPITRITDEVMANILKDDSKLLDRYMAVKNKKNRQSAANILVTLKEKGLIKG